MRDYGKFFYFKRALLLRFYYFTTKFDCATAKFNGKKFTLEVADTWVKIRLGLSFRHAVGESDGMIFVYGKSEPHIIWMFNTRIDLDVVWLDGKGRVVHLVKGAHKARSWLDFDVFEPKMHSEYVIELPAGYIAKYGIREGSLFSIGL